MVLLLLVAGSSLGACVGGGFIGDSAQFYQNPHDVVRVTVMRKPQFTGLALTLKIELDGKPIARLRPGDFIEFPVGPGRRFLRVSAKGAATNTLEKFEAIAGESYYFRVAVSGVIFSIEGLSPESGRKEVQRGYDEIQIPKR